MSIAFKATLQTHKHRFSLPPTATFADLTAKLNALFSLTTPYTLLCEDEEHDLVRLSSDADLAELLHLSAQHNLSPLRLHIRLPEPAAAPPHQQPRPLHPHSHTSASDFTPSPSAAPLPQQRSVPQLELGPPQQQLQLHYPQPIAPARESGPLATALSSVISAFTTSSSTYSYHDNTLHGQSHSARGTRSTRYTRAAPPPSPVQEVMATLSNLLPTLTANRSISALSALALTRVETRTALADLCNALSNHSPDAASHTARRSLPLLRDWASDNLPTTGLPRTRAIDTLATRVDAALRNSLGSRLARRISAFVRTALTDPAVVDAVRELPLADMSRQLIRAARDTRSRTARLPAA